MELLEGKNLNQTVRVDGPFRVARALPILIQVCGALDEAHKAGIIHRDLKPENLFLVQSASRRDFPKVLDFGLAKVGERQMRPGSVVLTQEGMVFGTPEFMSPEQAQGKKLTPASDVYSLAVILYEVLTGKLPFDAKSTMDYIQLHATGLPLPLNQRVPEKSFPPLLEQIIDRALAKRAEDRFDSVADFGAALQLVLDGATDLSPQLRQSVNRTAQTVQLRPVATPEGNPPFAQPAAAEREPRAGSAKVPLAANPQPAERRPTRLERRPSARLRQNRLGLLAAVAIASLIVGAGLAVLLVKFVAR